MKDEKHRDSGSSDWDATTSAGDFNWDGLEDEDEQLPPDSVDPEDPAVLQAMFDWDADQYDPEMLGGSECDAEVLSAEDFATELIDAGPDAAAALLDSMAPGPETAAMLAMLRPAALSSASMVSVVGATEKLLSWVQARQHRWLAAFACPGVAAPKAALKQYASQPGQPLHTEKRRGANREGGDDVISLDESSNTDLSVSGPAVHGADPAVDTVLTEVAVKVAAAEVGAALRLAPVTAQRRVCQAVEFAVDLPDTLRALEGGSIDRGRATMIAVRTQNLPVELRRRVEQAVLPKASGRTAGQVQGIVDRAVISVDPSAAKRRHNRAIADRNVSYQSGQDGIGVFRAELPADQAQVAFGVIDQLAEQLNRMPAELADDRGIGALRADAFSDLFDQLASTGTVSIGRTLNSRARPPASKTCSDNNTEFIGQETTARGDANQQASGAADGNPNDPSAADGQEDAEGPSVGENSCTTIQLGKSIEFGTSTGSATPAGRATPSGNAVLSGTALPSESASPAAGGASTGSAAPAGKTDSTTNPNAGNGGQGISTDAGECVPTDGADDDAPHCNQSNDNVNQATDDVTDETNEQSTGTSPNSGQPGSGQPKSGQPSSDETGSDQPGSDCQLTSDPVHIGTKLGTAQGRRTHLNVTIDAATLAGLNDRPGDLAGHGPIPADLARAIALSAETITAIALKTDCGSPLDLGRTTYRPRLAQRDHVTTRDQTCRFPGCRRAARRCQIDHSDEFCPGEADGGVTCPCNLCCLCAFHHGLKTGGLWDSVQHPDASITWTSPTGRNYSTRPREWPTESDDQPIAPATRPAVGEYESGHSGDRESGNGDQGVDAAPDTTQQSSGVRADPADRSSSEATVQSTKPNYDDEPPF